MRPAFLFFSLLISFLAVQAQIKTDGLKRNYQNGTRIDKSVAMEQEFFLNGNIEAEDDQLLEVLPGNS